MDLDKLEIEVNACSSCGYVNHSSEVIPRFIRNHPTSYHCYNCGAKLFQEVNIKMFKYLEEVEDE